MERVQAILSKAEDDKISIRNEFKLQLLKLSKRVCWSCMPPTVDAPLFIKPTPCLCMLPRIARPSW